MIRPPVDDCPHDVVIDQERMDGIWYGTCAACHVALMDSGPEDERGVPGWEPAEVLYVTETWHGHRIATEVG